MKGIIVLCINLVICNCYCSEFVNGYKSVINPDNNGYKLLFDVLHLQDNSINSNINNNINNINFNKEFSKIKSLILERKAFSEDKYINRNKKNSELINKNTFSKDDSLINEDNKLINENVFNKNLKLMHESIFNKDNNSINEEEQKNVQESKNDIIHIMNKQIESDNDNNQINNSGIRIIEPNIQGEQNKNGKIRRLYKDNKHIVLEHINDFKLCCGDCFNKMKMGKNFESNKSCEQLKHEKQINPTTTKNLKYKYDKESNNSNDNCSNSDIIYNINNNSNSISEFKQDKRKIINLKKNKKLVNQYNQNIISNRINTKQLSNNNNYINNLRNNYNYNNAGYLEYNSNNKLQLIPNNKHLDIDTLGHESSFEMEMFNKENDAIENDAIKNDKLNNVKKIKPAQINVSKINNNMQKSISISNEEQKYKKYQYNNAQNMYNNNLYDEGEKIYTNEKYNIKINKNIHGNNNIQNIKQAELDNVTINKYSKLEVPENNTKFHANIIEMENNNKPIRNIINESNNDIKQFIEEVDSHINNDECTFSNQRNFYRGNNDYNQSHILNNNIGNNLNYNDFMYNNQSIPYYFNAQFIPDFNNRFIPSFNNQFIPNNLNNMHSNTNRQGNAHPNPRNSNAFINNYGYIFFQ